MGAVNKEGVWSLDEQDRLGLSARDQVFEKNGQPAFNEDGSRKMEPTFHVVDEDGNTTIVIYRTWEGLRRAPASLIPLARIPGVTPQQLADLGYEAFDENGQRIEPSRQTDQQRSGLRIQVVSQFIPSGQ